MEAVRISSRRKKKLENKQRCSSRRKWHRQELSNRKLMGKIKKKGWKKDKDKEGRNRQPR
jgi:hypothetical protein